ncbi:MAG: two-component sensor histidine kinase [Gammaproteobacteria bacterium]|nr:two-component sensor histidine kinase [Gammaproteobacteria bacterium]
MFSSLRQSFRQFTSMKLLVLLLVLITLHLIIMFFYLKSSRTVRETVQRDAVIQKIINAIYLVEATPVTNRKHAVAVMADPNLKVSFTSQPEWAQRFSQISFWRISRALQEDLDSFSLSIMLDKNQWLNLHATVYSHVVAEQLLWFGLEVFIFGTILLAMWTISRYQRPLQEFKKAARRLGADVDAVPFNVNGPAVVRETAKALNDMQQRIRDLIRDRTQMLAAISHDLRTPITRLKIRTQFIDDEQQQQNYIKDLDEMENMIKEILAFARDDANKEQQSDLDIISLLYSICNDFRDMGHDISFTTMLHRQPFHGRSLALKRAFNNLIGNAIRYGKNVRVIVRKHYKNLIILVKDDGPGIPETDLERVFAPFYRAEHSRSRDTGGAGLGLAVTREIIKSHHGNVTLKNRKPHGLEVKVEFEQVGK